jgi:hypothetical protein
MAMDMTGQAGAAVIVRYHHTDRDQRARGRRAQYSIEGPI